MAQYCAALLACGATCIRIDRNVERIARAYGLDAHATIMPRHVHLSVCDRDGCDVHTAIATVPDTGISFDMNTRLSRLSWEVADSRPPLDFFESRYTAIMTDSRRHLRATTLLVALANASFCRLFGGDAGAMGVVFAATLAGYYVKLRLLAAGVDSRAVFAICAFVSSVIGATCSLFDIGSTPSIALGTSVLYLVPGIPYLNSLSDMLYRRYLCALGRFADAMVLTCCLSAGMCAGMWLMGAKMF